MTGGTGRFATLGRCADPTDRTPSRSFRLHGLRTGVFIIDQYEVRDERGEAVVLPEESVCLPSRPHMSPSAAVLNVILSQ